jgi:hypothetical protein
MALLTAAGLTVATVVPVGGVPIGSDSGIKDYLEKTLKRIKFEGLAQELVKLPSEQAAFHLLSTNLAAKMTYLARNVPPRLSHPILQATDRQLAWVLEKLMQLPGVASEYEFYHHHDPQALLVMQDHQRTQMALPVKHGGLGIRSTVETMFCAYAGSQNDVITLMLPTVLRQVSAGKQAAVREKLVMGERVSEYLSAIRELNARGVPVDKLQPTIDPSIVKAALDPAVAADLEPARRVALLFAPGVMGEGHKQSQRRLSAHVREVTLKAYNAALTVLPSPAHHYLINLHYHHQRLAPSSPRQPKRLKPGPFPSLSHLQAAG